MDGFSKTYAMTGWRIGYGVMNRDLAPLMARIETNIESCTCTFTQSAGIEALTGPQEEPQRFAAEFRRRAALVVDLLNDIDGVHCLKPRGAFYAFPNVTEACRRLGLKTAEQLAEGLLHEAGVAVLARSCFGPRNTGEEDEYVRISFATSEANIREGLSRMKRYIEAVR
jgi:aspartate/methionine/tyrosine aminotransferase